MQNAECKCRMQNAECKMEEMQMQNAKCRMQNAELRKISVASRGNYLPDNFVFA